MVHGQYSVLCSPQTMRHCTRTSLTSTTPGSARSPTNSKSKEINRDHDQYKARKKSKSKVRQERASAKSKDLGEKTTHQRDRHKTDRTIDVTFNGRHARQPKRHNALHLRQNNAETCFPLNLRNTAMAWSWAAPYAKKTCT